jgi:hypothetical protein
MKFQQQGDVLLKQVASIPKTATKKTGRAILAQGEATGHCHEALGDGVELYEKDGVLYLSAPSGAQVTHQEHHSLELPPGNYTIGIVKEYDHFSEEASQVRD